MLLALSTRSFRNLEDLDWHPGAGTHLLLGGNGAGKTSLLEALYLLATTRSFRTAQLADCVRHGASSFELAGEVDSDRRSALAVRLAGKERSRAVNGRATGLAEYLAVLPVVAWSAAEIEVLVGAPVHRRRFLDRGVVALSPSALAALTRYREALRQKRELLLQDAPGLEVWNDLLAAAAHEVIRRRQAYAARLEAELGLVVAASGLDFPPIALRYRPSPSRGLEGAAAIAEQLAHIAPREKRRQLPLLGPHRDELDILWGEHEIRRVASAGERKALSLLLLAAAGRILETAGRPPLYLLDDTDAELAPPTLAAVWQVFAPAPQLLATSNRPKVWLTLAVGSLWEVERGAVRAL